MARGVEEIADLPDPVGRVLARFERPNGLVIERVATPLGVIGVIYESRPNVTADAGALCLKSGNAAILRGGSEAIRSSALRPEAATNFFTISAVAGMIGRPSVQPCSYAYS